MHKFNLEIEIPDKDYCNGCPLLNVSAEACRYYLLATPMNETSSGFGGYKRLKICKQNDKEKTK